MAVRDFPGHWAIQVATRNLRDYLGNSTSPQMSAGGLVLLASAAGYRLEASRVPLAVSESRGGACWSRIM